MNWVKGKIPIHNLSHVFAPWHRHWLCQFCISLKPVKFSGFSVCPYLLYPANPNTKIHPFSSAPNPLALFHLKFQCLPPKSNNGLPYRSPVSICCSDTSHRKLSKTQIWSQYLLFLLTPAQNSSILTSVYKTKSKLFLLVFLISHHCLWTSL
jgi:hypothetical protein